MASALPRPVCSTSVEESHHFCPSCGADLAEEEGRTAPPGLDAAGWTRFAGRLRERHPAEPLGRDLSR